MSNIGASYKQHGIPADNYDAIVIGSGIGGLGAAALLTLHANQKVLVLEQHYTAGGFTHTFRRPGYEWDVGVHYIGNMHEGSTLRALFDEVTGGELEWADMGEVYDRILIGDDTYDFVRGRANFVAQLKSYFPDETEAIDRYMELVESVNRHSMAYFGERALPRPLAAVLGPLMRMPMARFATRTTWDVISELTDNTRLIAVLTGQYGDYGLPPRQSSFLMHALVAGHYFAGGYYPVGGSSRFAQTILPVIESGGGKVLTRAAVDEILIEDGKAVGVRLEDGVEVRAPMVISNAGVHNTVQRMLPAATRSAHGLDERARRVGASVAHVCLYVGLTKTASELGLQTPNLWVYPSEDHDGNIARFTEDPDADLPVVYLSFPAAKDPTFEERFPGRATIEAITLGPYEWFAKYADSPWKKRGAEYEALKKKVSDRLLQTLLKHCPQIEPALDHLELSTPLSTRHFTAFQRGEIYGLEHTPKRYKQRWLRPRTPVPGLYLTGADVCSAGVSGALLGAVLCASAITGKNLMTKIAKSPKTRSRSRAA